MNRVARSGARAADRRAVGTRRRVRAVAADTSAHGRNLPTPGVGARRVAPGLPDPPLVDRVAGIALRPWSDTSTDAAALSAAWSDPALAASPGLPADRTPAGAARWIRGEPARRAAGLCLDLVVVQADDPAIVFGEVGLRNIDPVRRRGELSWWILTPHRGRGLAAAAAGVLAAWSLSPDGGLDQVWARIPPGNVASARVAAASGLTALGEAAGSVIWARSRPGDNRCPERRPGTATLPS